jgi:DNA-directed RNA polymerase II subunit RPB1
METQDYDIDTIHQIQRIDFDVYGNDEILENSVFGKGNGMESFELFEKSEPRRGGPIDPRLGTTSNDINCATCGLSTKYCTGHSAHINLSEYLFHIGYIHIVAKILSCVCIRCSKILLHKNEEEIKEIIRTKTPKERLAYIRNATKNVSYCQKTNFGCGTPHPKIKIEPDKKTNKIHIIATYEETENDNQGGQAGKKSKLEEILTPEMVYDILKNISDYDCVLLGLDPKRTRPEYMIHKIFFVPPVQMRPSVRGEFTGGMVMADYLTAQLVNIIKINLRIIKNKENQTENSSRFHSEYAHLLQSHVATYMENEPLGMSRAEQKGRPVKPVADRLKGKPIRLLGSI